MAIWSTINEVYIFLTMICFLKLLIHLFLKWTCDACLESFDVSLKSSRTTSTRWAWSTYLFISRYFCLFLLIVTVGLLLSSSCTPLLITATSTSGVKVNLDTDKSRRKEHFLMHKDVLRNETSHKLFSKSKRHQKKKANAAGFIMFVEISYLPANKYFMTRIKIPDCDFPFSKKREQDDNQIRENTGRSLHNEFHDSFYRSLSITQNAWPISDEVAEDRFQHFRLGGTRALLEAGNAENTAQNADVTNSPVDLNQHRVPYSQSYSHSVSSLLRSSRSSGFSSLVLYDEEDFDLEVQFSSNHDIRPTSSGYSSRRIVSGSFSLSRNMRAIVEPENDIENVAQTFNTRYLLQSYFPSNLRNEISREPEEIQESESVDLRGVASRSSDSLSGLQEITSNEVCMPARHLCETPETNPQHMQKMTVSLRENTTIKETQGNVLVATSTPAEDSPGDNQRPLPYAQSSIPPFQLPPDGSSIEDIPPAARYQSLKGSMAVNCPPMYNRSEDHSFTNPNHLDKMRRVGMPDANCISSVVRRVGMSDANCSSNGGCGYGQSINGHDCRMGNDESQEHFHRNSSHYGKHRIQFEKGKENTSQQGMCLPVLSILKNTQCPVIRPGTASKDNLGNVDVHNVPEPSDEELFGDGVVSNSNAISGQDRVAISGQVREAILGQVREAISGQEGVAISGQEREIVQDAEEEGPEHEATNCHFDPGDRHKRPDDHTF